MEENVQDITVDESTTDNSATNSETTVDNTNQPFRVYNTEEEYSKDIKSISMKKVNELYKELGIKSKEESITAITNAKRVEELENNYKTLSDEYEKFKTDSESKSKENEALSRQLVMNKLNISDNKEVQEDFMTAVEAIMTKKNISFEEAATEFVEKYPTFKKSILDNSPVKVGAEKSNLSDDPVSGVEAAFAKLNRSWYKK